MKSDDIKRIIEETGGYDETREDSLRSMLGDFYSRKMLSVVVLIWVCVLISLGLSIASAVLFFRADLVKDQVMYAALFIVFTSWVSLAKIFAWQMIHRNRIVRAIKLLELRIAESTAGSTS